MNYIDEAIQLCKDMINFCMEDDNQEEVKTFESLKTKFEHLQKERTNE